jgi:hypothetical protein
MIVANILNKKSQTAEEGWSSSFETWDWGCQTLTIKKKLGQDSLNDLS